MKKFREMSDQELIQFINKAGVLNENVPGHAIIDRITCEEFCSETTFEIPKDHEVFEEMSIEEKLVFLNEQTLEDRIYKWGVDLSSIVQEKFDDGDELIFFYVEHSEYVLITDPENSQTGYAWNWIINDDDVVYNYETKRYERAK